MAPKGTSPQKSTLWNLLTFRCVSCQPLFPGESGVDQLVEIIKVLGTPTREEIKCMNPNYTEFKFPQIKAHPWHKVSQPWLPSLLSSLLSLLPVPATSPVR